jgi:hypothetical protein
MIQFARSQPTRAVFPKREQSLIKSKPGVGPQTTTCDPSIDGIDIAPILFIRHPCKVSIKFFKGTKIPEVDEAFLGNALFDIHTSQIDRYRPCLETVKDLFGYITGRKYRMIRVFEA